MKRVAVPLWLALHLALLVGLYTWRSPPEEFIQKAKAFQAGTLERGAGTLLKLHFSRVQDEAYYYEWSTLVLGKEFEPGYPLAERTQSPVFRWLGEPARARMPYRDLPFEYPPLLMAPLLASRAVSQTYIGFTRALAFLVAIAYLGALAVAHRIWRSLDPARQTSWPTILGYSAVAVFLLGQLWVTRLDVFPSLLYLLALQEFVAGRITRGSAWLSAGVMTKAYAVVLAPIVALWLHRQGRYRELAIGAAVVLALVLGTTVGLGWVSEGGYWDAYRFHAGRGIQIESIYALIPLLSHMVLGTPIRIFEDHYSATVSSPITGALLTASSILPVVTLLAIYALFWRRVNRSESKPDGSILIVPALLAVYGFILTFKVLSPQFLLWLMPLIFLVRPRRSGTFFGVFLALLALTQLIVPHFYFLLEDGKPVGTLLLLARNAGLAFLFGWLLRDWTTIERPAPKSGPAPSRALA